MRVTFRKTVVLSGALHHWGLTYELPSALADEALSAGYAVPEGQPLEVPSKRSETNAERRERLAPTVSDGAPRATANRERRAEQVLAAGPGAERARQNIERRAHLAPTFDAEAARKRAAGNAARRLNQNLSPDTAAAAHRARANAERRRRLLTEG